MSEDITEQVKEDEKKESTATNARRNIYFNKENLDLYYFLQQKGYKGTEFACRAIRKLMEEEMSEESFEELENPTNLAVLKRIRVLEERQLNREQQMVLELTEKINQSLRKEVEILKDMLRSVQAQLSAGVVMTHAPGYTLQSQKDSIEYETQTENCEFLLPSKENSSLLSF